MKLAIVAGEASGDLHASEVVQELKRLDPALVTFGIGGDLLAAEGMTLLHHAKEMGIVGLFNVLRHLRMFRRIFEELIARLERERPDGVLLVDYPDFNLRVAKKCRELGIKVIYYISPQVWAWRRGRVKQIAARVDRMLVLFPFEEAFYREHGVPVTYVGHPLIDELADVRKENVGPALSRPSINGSIGPAESRPYMLRIALLPGSRKGEVESLLPPMLEAIAVLRREQDVDATLVQAPTIAREQLERLARDADVRIVAHREGQSIADADIALSSSGTATLECAVVGTPVVVMYRLTPATHWLARKLVKLPYFSLVNIIAGKEVVPELLQQEVNGRRIAEEVWKLADPERYAAVVRELEEVRRMLGGPGASRRAAEAIMSVLRK
ncbi:MAG TPA: lipid-A-disaccharide synthase [Thermoanaerobaculia bacterium]|jgi:lipid-A-disaccharide synthase|nr:lipid-A-disaccharide synthase [Thermoanaerobaculia bacterium]